MASKKPPKHDTWMPLYVGDYLAKTQNLSAEQHGAYLLLMMAAWKNGGHLPNDPDDLHQIARMTPQQWTRNEPKLRKFFTVTDDAWTHDRVSEELSRAREIVAKKSAAGKLGAAKTWGLKIVSGGDS